MTKTRWHKGDDGWEPVAAAEVVTPTQAEMAALLQRVLKLAKTGHWRDKAGLSLEAHPLMDEILALTAAAEVGEPDNRLSTRDDRPDIDAILKARGNIEAATIERCAQVALSFLTEGDSWADGRTRNIAAAIRALTAAK